MLKILTLLALLHPVAPAADSLSGTWQISGDIIGNPFAEVCTVKQEGTALTGSCTIEGAQPRALTGEVKDGKVSISHGGDYEGQALTLVYSGTVASPTEFKGTLTIQPFDVGGAFTATLAPPKP